MNFIDTHSHLFAEEFKEDLLQAIKRAKEVGVSRVYLPNIDCSTLQPMLDTASQYPGYCFPMLGLHPTSVGTNYREELELMNKRLHTEHPFVAIGEVGMDLYWDKTYVNEQIEAFDTQIQWAIEYKLPLVIHSRESFNEVEFCLSKYSNQDLKGIFHSFTGTAEEASVLLKHEDFYLGINGVVTFKKSTLPEVLKQVPLERLVLETDSPYLAPVPNRGKRNESSYVKHVLSKLSDIYECSEEIVADITTKNALKLFGY